MNQELVEQLGNRLCDILRIPRHASNPGQAAALKQVAEIALPPLLAGECVSLVHLGQPTGEGLHTLDIRVVRTKENNQNHE